MKRAILVLMIVVFALVTVVPTFALSQDFHGLGMSQTDELRGVIDPSNAAVDYFGADTTVPEDDIIAVLRQSSLTVRKAGGDQQDW